MLGDIQREVLEQARPMMIEGWDGVVSARVVGAADTPLSKSMQSEKQTMSQFLQLLQDRIVRHYYYNYNYCYHFTKRVAEYLHSNVCHRE